ncbi:MAG: hypothetical protein AB8B50_05010 [Pirellulaceae bacterium]
MKKVCSALVALALVLPLAGCGANTEVKEPEGGYTPPPVSEDDMKGSSRSVDKKIKDKVGQTEEPVY